MNLKGSLLENGGAQRIRTIIGSLKGREGLQLLRKGGDRKRRVGKMSVIEIHGLQVWKFA